METFPRYWSFVRRIHRSPANSPHKGQWHGALMFSLICALNNGWVHNREAGDLRPHRTHYDVNFNGCTDVECQRWQFFETGVMKCLLLLWLLSWTSQIAKSTWYWSDAKVSDRYLMEVDPVVFAVWEQHLLKLVMLSHQRYSAVNHLFTQTTKVCQCWFSVKTKKRNKKQTEIKHASCFPVMCYYYIIRTNFIINFRNQGCTHVYKNNLTYSLKVNKIKM